MSIPCLRHVSKGWQKSYPSIPARQKQHSNPVKSVSLLKKHLNLLKKKKKKTEGKK